jgi:hypothetical protein
MHELILNPDFENMVYNQAFEYMESAIFDRKSLVR